MLGRCKNNVLVIGQRYSWLVHASPCHSGHFVGCRAVTGLTSKAGEVAAYQRLHDFASRFAAPGATVSVYCLHATEACARPAAQFQKKADALFQPPGCYWPNTNGIKLHAFIKMPIE